MVVLSCSCAVLCHGLVSQGEVLRIRRPHDYNPAHAKQLGPSEPSSYINLALLSVVGGLVDEATAPRISVAGLPKHLEDDQVGRGVQQQPARCDIARAFTQPSAGLVCWVCCAAQPSWLRSMGSSSQWVQACGRLQAGVPCTLLMQPRSHALPVL